MTLTRPGIPDAYTYQLPQDRIAQRPVYPYDAARLLVVDPGQTAVSESCFADIASCLLPEDLLVFNDSKVIPARLLGTRVDTGGQVELLLIREQEAGIWRALGKPLKRIRSGLEIDFAGVLRGRVLDRLGEQELLIDFSLPADQVSAALESVGHMPIPPYIRNGMSDAADRTDYQSLFARDAGSIAAPTASLHFTPAVLASLKQRGVETVTVTLHVGTASFLPLNKAGQETVNLPGAEEFSISDATWEIIQNAKVAGRRIVAVGTTVVRALEAKVAGDGATTELFITPGFDFQVCDAIVTNFHQPGTTHLLLVQAFIGRRLLELSYAYALDNGFRFLSYGDGMLLQRRIKE